MIRNNIKLFCLALVVMVTFSSMARAETQWKKGAWIGAVAGGATVGALTTIAAAGFEGMEGDFNYGAGGVVLIGLAGATAGALIGGGTGALIGLAFEKKDYAISPIMNEKMLGMAFSKSF